MDEDMVAVGTSADWQVMLFVAYVLGARLHNRFRLPFDVLGVPQHPNNDLIDNGSVNQEDFLDLFRSKIAL